MAGIEWRKFPNMDLRVTDMGFGAAPEPIMEKVRKIETVCCAYKVPLPAAALQFVLVHPISADPWRELKHEGLVRREAPVPP